MQVMAEFYVNLSGEMQSTHEHRLGELVSYTTGNEMTVDFSTDEFEYERHGEYWYEINGESAAKFWIVQEVK